VPADQDVESVGKWRILKNIAVISVAFLLQFTAFQGTGSLQSSINAAGGLGTTSLSAVFGAIIISCAFIPTLAIRKLTAKWTLCLSMLCYVPYIMSQFYPQFYTLIPAGCLAGLGAAPMWAAQSTYLTQVAYIYARVTQQPPEAAIVRFFGIFYLCWQSAELWGNLISGLVLSAPHTNETDASDYTLCGANFCASKLKDIANLHRPPDREIFTIMGIYLACICLAVILLIFLLDPLTMYGEQRGGGKVSVIKLLVATFRQLRKPNQLLLVPLTTFIGMEQANFAADLTQAFISCTLGISEIGFILVSFGLCNSLFSLIFGFLTKKFGRIWILIIGLIAISACYLIMLLWQPSPHQKWMFFLICCLYALGDSILQIQINGMYGAIFEKNKEAAFSNYRLFESLGYLVTYALSTVLCARTKLISALGLLVIGTVGWIVVEWRVKSSKSFESNKLDETKATHAEVYKVIEG
uniref:Putative conserved plasma membrane protein n=1 Tax=Lutzomyia longipalpis TaxID=7200 RepID=A0A1B0CPZ7_LUTLO